MKKLTTILIAILLFSGIVYAIASTDRLDAEETYQELINAIPESSLSYNVVKNVYVEGEHYVNICYNITVEFDYEDKYQNCINFPAYISKGELNTYLDRQLAIAIEDSRPLDIEYPTDRGDLDNQ